MTKHLKICAVVVVVGVLLLGIGWGGLAVAKTPAAPPTLAQVLGTWSYTGSMATYDLTTGADVTSSVKGTATITSVSDDQVNMHEVYSGGNDNEPAYYSGGMFLYGWSDDQTFGTTAGAACLFVAGKPGKLTAKGQEVGYDAQYNYLYTITYSFKQTATN